jgi:hypothetical protein
MRILRSGLARSANRLEPISPHLAGRLDHLHRLHDEGFGILNGQSQCQRVVESLIRHLEVVDAIETGTFRGTTTEFLAGLVPGNVYTVESQPRAYTSSELRFRRNARVHVCFGDSRDFLKALAADHEPKPRTLFYLDAHWEENLPLAEELTIIDEGPWIDPIVIIDDFEVPDDPGYEFDDYGPGKRIGPAILPPAVMRGRALLLPGVRASVETGRRRGYAVLVRSGDVSRALEGTTLRVAG